MIANVTTKQSEVLEQVKELLAEHFDAFTFAVEVDDINDANDIEQQAFYGGGRTRCLGMLEIHKARMIHYACNNSTQE